VKRKLIYSIITIIVIYLLLLISFERNESPKVAVNKQFVWNRDSLWLSLESFYVEAKKKTCAQLNKEINNSLKFLNAVLDSIEITSLLPTDSKFLRIENGIFYTAALVGACQEHIPDFINLFSRIRNAVKEQSLKWDLGDIVVRQTLYKLIYGGRAAVEELLLQGDKNKIPSLIIGKEEISLTPTTIINGLVIHSGDILISRGGAPTSALIARGNDYPGNFSHAALVYVDEKTGKTYIIESHIERGVTLSSIDDYMNDKKLRIMVLRLRADHTKMLQDKMLPHKAAKFSFEQASSQHIAYDFEMNFNDNTKLFCSEVASFAYKKYDINLWRGLSTISSKGVAKWLSGFGVKNFVTQEPSDLEYDSQLTVVAEWRDAITLFKDHIDNAIIEALLEQAEAGKELGYDWYLLPIARTMKLYSALLNLFDKVGPVPEGMSPESALRHKKLVAIHEEIKNEVENKAKKFVEQMNYNPPYWKLVSFARESIKERNILQ